MYKPKSLIKRVSGHVGDVIREVKDHIYPPKTSYIRYDCSDAKSIDFNNKNAEFEFIIQPNCIFKPDRLSFNIFEPGLVYIDSIIVNNHHIAIGNGKVDVCIYNPNSNVYLVLPTVSPGNKIIITGRTSGRLPKFISPFLKSRYIQQKSDEFESLKIGRKIRKIPIYKSVEVFDRDYSFTLVASCQGPAI